MSTSELFPEYVTIIESNLNLNFVPSIQNGQVVAYLSEPSKKFWLVYKEKKELLKEEGILVYKNGTKYVVYFKPNVDLYKQISIKDQNDFQKFLKTFKPSQFLKSHLFPWQLERLAELVYGFKKFASGGMLDGSELGTGKTLQNLAIASYFKIPVFAVVPAGVVTQWIRWSKYLKINLIDVMSYDTLKRSNSDYVSFDPISESFTFNEKLIPKKSLIIFDEAHKCKNPKTLNAKLLLSAKKQKYLITVLSATIAYSPLHLKITGYAIGLFEQLSNYYSWSLEHGCYLGNVGKKGSKKKTIIFSNLPSSLIKIYNSIFGSGRGVRTKASELGDAFPKNNIIIQAYDMVEEKKINDVFRSMKKELQELKKNKQKDKKSKLTIILRARQEVELLKVPNFVNMVEESLENGLSVVVFVNFIQTLESLVTKLKKYNPSVIRGKQTQQVREKNKEDFQNNKTKLCIAQIQSGGTGIDLHDVHGGHPRTTIISPTYNPDDLIQSTGRTARVGSKSHVTQRIVFASNTIEELVVEAIKNKTRNLNTINDGELNKGYE
jgi:superfamily II DNA or RNA helicase